jgi:hypothetical protein
VAKNKKMLRGFATHQMGSATFIVDKKASRGVAGGRWIAATNRECCRTWTALFAPLA